MSYINEALKKAQEEKNSRYGNFDYAVSDSVARRDHTAKMRRVIFVVIFVVSAGAALIAVKFLLPVSAADGESLFAKIGSVFAGSVERQKLPKAEKPVETGALGAGARQKSAVTPSPITEKALADQNKAAEAKRLYEEAAIAGRSGNFSKAKLLYGETLTLAPDNVEAMNNLGVVFLSEKKQDKALSLFRRAIVLKRDYADPYYNMACLYAQKNDISQSLWYLKIAISIDKEVKNWAKRDADMNKVVMSPKFKEIDGGAKN
jgi:tetratricopeptide (TPR) repeat protein